MKQSRAKLAALIADRAQAPGAKTKHLATEVAAYLLENRRTAELNSLLRDVQVVLAERGTVEVLAASAYPLTGEVKSRIERQVKQVFPSAQRIIVTEQIDRSAIGGVRISFVNRQLDLSIAGKLNKFKQLASAGKD